MVASHIAGLSVWGGSLKSEQTGRINALLKRAAKYEFAESIYDSGGMQLHIGQLIAFCLKTFGIKIMACRPMNRHLP
jgi:hypothetical protein